MLIINLVDEGIRNTLRGRRWREKHPDETAKRVAVWRRQNPEKAQSALKYGREYYQKNRISMLSRVASYAEAHPDKREAHKVKISKWKKDNPEKMAIYHNLRRTRETGAGGVYTLEQFKALGTTCLCCGKDEETLRVLGRRLVPDHILAVAKGGTNDISNIQPLCHGKSGCNNRKGTKYVDYRKSRSTAAGKG